MSLPACLQVFSEENITKTHVPFIIMSVYILATTWLVPAFMKHREPFHLKKLIIAYNFLQVVINIYLFIKMSGHGITFRDIHCGIVQHPRFPEVWKTVRNTIELAYLVKVLDLFDTVFFVLRKKDRNVTFLHVYHHAAIIVLFFFAMKTFRVGISFGFGLGINCFVHAVMYLYYGLAAFGPRMKKYLWWKRYLTIFQMVQFTLIMLFMVINLIFGCEDLGEIGIIIFVYVFTVLLLFLNFYRKAFKIKCT